MVIRRGVILMATGLCGSSPGALVAASRLVLSSMSFPLFILLHTRCRRRTNSVAPQRRTARIFRVRFALLRDLSQAGAHVFVLGCVQHVFRA